MFFLLRHGKGVVQFEQAVPGFLKSTLMVVQQRCQAGSGGTTLSIDSFGGKQVAVRGTVKMFTCLVSYAGRQAVVPMLKPGQVVSPALCKGLQCCCGIGCLCLDLCQQSECLRLAIDRSKGIRRRQQARERVRVIGPLGGNAQKPLQGSLRLASDAP